MGGIRRGALPALSALLAFTPPRLRCRCFDAKSIVNRLRCRHFISPRSPPSTAPPTSHLSIVPTLLAQTLQPGDFAVDATCGNGHDTQTLLSCCGSSGHVVAIDVQEEAIKATRERLHLDSRSSVTFFNGNHRDLSIVDKTLLKWSGDTSLHDGSVLSEDGFAQGGAVKAWVYNLGYLPGSDRSITTQTADTVASLRGAQMRTARGGLVCVTVYVGHEGGKEEADAVRAEMASWDQAVWRVVEHRPLNWPRSPILYSAHRFVMPRKKLPKRNDPF